MKRQDRSYSVTLPPSRLYLEDVERIAEIMKGVAPCVEIQADEYVLDDIAELSNLGESCIHSLNLYVPKACVTVWFEPWGAGAQIERDAPLERGTLEKIVSIVQQRKRTVFRYLLGLPGFIAFLAAYTGLCYELARKSASVASTGSLMSTGLVCLLPLGLVPVLLKYRNSHYSTIVLKRRIDTPSFFKQNGEKILLHLINTAIAGAVGYVIRLLQD